MKRDQVNGILINDTSGTSNPGCQGTVHCLLNGFQKQGITFISRVPVGHFYDLFLGCYADPATPWSMRRVRNGIRRRCGFETESPISSQNRRICPSKLEHAIGIVQDRMAPAWSSADFLLVNGEGTIHHDNVGAISLVAFCAAASRLHKRVALVNCSITNLDEFMLGVLRESVDYLSVREPITQRYLETNGIRSTLSADCLFLAQQFSASAESAFLRVPYPEPYVIYTPGVLSGSGSVNAQQIASDIGVLRTQGDSVIYLTVEAEDERLAVSASKAGAEILPLGFVRWNQMPTLLAGAKLVVSGRYHINIFAALAGVPFIPMATNTQKMQGLLELLSPDAPITVRSWGSREISAEPLDLGLAFTASPEVLETCTNLALRNFNFLADHSSEMNQSTDSLVFL